MKIKNLIISLFLLHILYIQIFSNYVILPFNTKKLNSSSFTSKTNYYTLLSIGQPQKTVEMYLILKRYNFYLGKGLCYSNSFSDYIPHKSETFKNYSDYQYAIDLLENATNATDNYFLYTNDLNLKKNITIKDMQFYYGINTFIAESVDNETICGIIGFNAYYFDHKYKENFFMSILKQKDVISSYSFSFIFSNNYNKNTIFSKNNKYDNYLVIGMNETEISKTFNSNDLRTIYINKTYTTSDWRISIDEFFFDYSYFTNINTNKKLRSSNTMANFDNEFDFIISPKTDFDFFYNYFFKIYTEENICTLNETNESYYNFYYISCDINFQKQINKFPNINFMIRDINYTFTLTYKDLFIEFNQKIYFMLVKNDYSYFWIFGNIFFKKFPLIFDYDKKTITFIILNNTINNEKGFRFNFLLFFIGGVCIIIGICFGVIIGKIICNKNKRKKANELVDDYDYNLKQENNEQKLNESNNIINN